jgi:hypothetical protein
MLNQQPFAETALVPPRWVEQRLGISRAKRLGLEKDGTLTAIRLGKNGHRRYNPAQVESLLAALAEGGDAA